MNLNAKIQDWSDINWSKVHETVKEMRSQIFLAKRQGNNIKLRKLQTSMLKSKSNLLLAIRRVTSVNQGKKTPGSTTCVANPKQRFKLYEQLSQVKLSQWKPLPIRRVYIPKSNKKLRSLAILTISDRIIQSVFKNALEPEWEAVFEYCSYGFRPSRSYQDAMIRTYKTLSKKKRTWILEGDIKGCFENINHKVLLEKLEDFPDKNVIEKWLKSGYLENDLFNPTDPGTPQNGIISPLLANIALHGLEKALHIKYHKDGYVRSECAHVLIRYADDFIVLNRTQQDALLSKYLIENELSKIGLILSEEKTNITEARKGFDFLGFQFRIFHDKRKRSDEVIRVQPSPSNKIKYLSRFKEIWRKSVGNKLELLIRPLNEQIIGIAYYYQYSNSNKFFRSMDHFNYLQAVRFIRRSHPNKSWKWLKSTYFRTKDRDNWTFYDKNSGIDLLKFKNIGMAKGWIPVKYAAVPDDPQWRTYFEERKLSQFKKKYHNRIKMIR